jgi:uncharacterized protein YjbI with pentapeptide repeats
LDIIRCGGKGCAYDSFDQVDLRAAVLVDATLQETALTNCMLDNATFQFAMANGLKLDGSSAKDAVFIDTQLEGASFVGCDLTGTVMRDCAIEEVDFSRASLRNAVMSSCNAYQACFVQADLTNLDLSYTSLRLADFREAKMIGTCLTGALLYSSTKLAPTTSLQEIIASYVFVDDVRIEGKDAVHAAMNKLRS